MKRKTVTNIIFIICCLSTYAQDSIFSAKVYYSTLNEITIEIENLTDQEMVLFINENGIGGSYINLYKKEGEYKSEKLINHPLKPTDSLRVLAKIPKNKIHVSKYKVKDKALSKVFLQMTYSLNFTSSSASTKWTSSSQEMNILPYDSLRKPVNKNRIADKKERLSGEYVYSFPEIKPEFPGGKKELHIFLSEETTRYECGIHASVSVRVVIEKDGSLTHPYLMTGNDPNLQKAALEIIQRMPKWKPGLNKGKPVRTFQNIFILFKWT